jgi:hypothetical protein
MLRVIIKCLRKQLEHVIHQPTTKIVHMQKGQQIKSTRNEPMNAPNMETT